jgi:hypothetical protein
MQYRAVMCCLAGWLRLPLWVFKPQPPSLDSLLHWHMKTVLLTTDLAAYRLAFTRARQLHLTTSTPFASDPPCAIDPSSLLRRRADTLLPGA